KFFGVQIGAITYSFNSIANPDAEAIIKAYVEIGLGEAELMSNHCESLAGAPSAGGGFGGGGGAGRGAGAAGAARQGQWLAHRAQCRAVRVQCRVAWLALPGRRRALRVALRVLQAQRRAGDRAAARGVAAGGL